VRKGEIKRDDQVVAVLTGHILKDPGVLLTYHRDLDPPPPGANRPLEIDADIREIERALKHR
jgi:threonine synthase